MTSISRTRVGRRATIGVVIAAALVCGLVTLPGARHSAAAAAVATPAPSLNAGLATVQTVRAVFVFDGQDRDAAYAVDRVAFAAAANGDRYFDIRYKPDYAALQREWRAALKADPHASITDLEARSLGALTRQVLVVSGQRGIEQLKSWVVNPLTHKVIGVRYRYYAGLFSSYPLAAAPPRSVQYVWALSTVLDTELASQGQRVTIAATPLPDGPAHRVTAFTGAKPAYEALIDRYGLTEQVTSLVGSRALQPFRLIPFHLESLEVNRAIAPSLFVMKPDYRYAPRGYGRPKSSDTPAKYGIDLGERAVPLADLNRFTSSWTLLPTWLPAGYRLALATRASDGERLWLTYRLGMDELTVSTAGTHAGWIADYDVGHGFVVQTWPSQPQQGGYGWAALGDTVGTMRGGAMKGWPTGSGVSLEPGRAFVATVAFGVYGTEPVSTLRRVAESVRPAKPGPHLPGSTYDRWPWLMAIAAAAALVLAWRRAKAQTATGADAPSAARSTSPLRRARLSLIGTAVVVAGVPLSWHRLYGAGDHFALRGWQEPLAAVTVSLALLGGAAALRSPGPPAHPHVSSRLLTVLLGLATLAGAVLSLLYLPVKARFVTSQDLSVPSWATFHSLVLNWGFPLPGPGLWLAIAGAIVLVIGAWRLRPVTSVRSEERADALSEA